MNREQLLAMAKPCHHVVHPFCPQSCWKAAAIVFSDAFKAALPVYTSVFLLPALLRRESLRRIFQKTIPSIFWSTTFMANLGGGMLPISCFLRWLNGSFSPFSVFLAGALNALFSIFIEDKKRRPELAVYSFNQALEALYRMGIVRGYLPSFNSADIFLFALASSILSYFCHKDLQIRTQAIQQPHDDNPSLRNVSQMIKVVVGDIRKTSFIDIIKDTSRGFLMGFAFRGSLNLVSNMLINRSRSGILKASFGKSTRDFALFLAAFVGGWRGVPQIMKYLRNKDDDWNHVIGGAVAGLSIAFSRSSDITMYFVAKAMETIFNELAKRNIVKKIKYGEVALFSLAVGVIFYCSVLEPFNLRPSYWYFLHRMSKGRYDQFEEIARIWKPEFFEKTGFTYSKKSVRLLINT